MVRPANLPPSTSVAPAKSALHKKPAEGVVGTEPVAAAKPRRKASKSQSEGKRRLKIYRDNRTVEAAVDTSYVSPLTDAFIWRIIKCHRRDRGLEYKVSKQAFALLSDLAHNAGDALMERLAGVVIIADSHVVTARHVQQANEIVGFKRHAVQYQQTPRAFTERARQACVNYKKQKALASVERKARKEAKAAAEAAVAAN